MFWWIFLNPIFFRGDGLPVVGPVDLHGRFPDGRIHLVGRKSVQQGTRTEHSCGQEPVAHFQSRPKG